MRDFFKSKINITLVVIQALALLFLCFCNLSGVCVMIAIALEGVFFIVYGSTYFFENKKINKNKDLYELLPIEEAEKKQITTKNSKNKKFNFFKGLMFIFFGIILVFIVLFQ